MYFPSMLGWPSISKILHACMHGSVDGLGLVASIIFILMTVMIYCNNSIYGSMQRGMVPIVTDMETCVLKRWSNKKNTCSISLQTRPRRRNPAGSSHNCSRTQKAKQKHMHFIQLIASYNQY